MPDQITSSMSDAIMPPAEIDGLATDRVRAAVQPAFAAVAGATPAQAAGVFTSNLVAVPEELKAQSTWICWVSVTGTGTPYQLPNGTFTRPLEPRPKPHKLPINPHTGGLASSTEGSTWATYEGAIAA